MILIVTNIGSNTIAFAVRSAEANRLGLQLNSPN